MALAGRRVVWGQVMGGNTQYGVEIFTAAPGSRQRRLLGYDVPYDEGSFPGQDAMAGDRHSLVVAGERGAYRVTPAAALIPLTDGTVEVAASRNRFALARQLGGGCICNKIPTWSSDGHKLAFVGHRRAGGPGEIYVVDADGQNLKELVQPAGVSTATEEIVFDWAPDDAGVVYVEQAGMSIVDLSGRSQRLSNEKQFSTVAWSPKKQLVAYAAYRGNGSVVRVLNVATRAVTTIATEKWPVDSVTWSRDATRIAYMRKRDLRIVSSAGGVPRTAATQVDAYEWAPDGRELTISRSFQGIAAVSAADNTERTLAKGQLELVGWSPDGRSVAYWRADNEPGLHLVAPDGTNDRKIAAGGGSNASWAPDSSSLAFTADDTSGPSIVVAAESGTKRVAAGAIPRWSPDSGRIAFLLPSDPFEAVWGEIGAVARDGSGPRALTKTEPEPSRDLVEIRAWPAGQIVASSDVDGTLDAVALDGNRTCVLLERSATKWLQIRSLNGAIEREVRVPGSVANELSMADRWVVFRSGRTVRLLDRRSGALATLTVAAGNVIGLSIEGRRVAWAEQRRGADRIRAITLPR